MTGGTGSDCGRTGVTGRTRVTGRTGVTGGTGVTSVTVGRTGEVRALLVCST